MNIQSLIILNFSNHFVFQPTVSHLQRQTAVLDGIAQVAPSCLCLHLVTTPPPTFPLAHVPWPTTQEVSAGLAPSVHLVHRIQYSVRLDSTVTSVDWTPQLGHAMQGWWLSLLSILLVGCWEVVVVVWRFLLLLVVVVDVVFVDVVLGGKNGGWEGGF